LTSDLEALVVAAYVFADEFRVPARPGPRAEINDAELVALAVCQAAMGISPAVAQFQFRARGGVASPPLCPERRFTVCESNAEFDRTADVNATAGWLDGFHDQRLRAYFPLK